MVDLVLWLTVQYLNRKYLVSLLFEFVVRYEVCLLIKPIFWRNNEPSVSQIIERERKEGEDRRQCITRLGRSFGDLYFLVTWLRLWHNRRNNLPHSYGPHSQGRAHFVAKSHKAF